MSVSTNYNLTDLFNKINYFKEYINNNFDIKKDVLQMLTQKIFDKYMKEDEKNRLLYSNQSYYSLFENSKVYSQLYNDIKNGLLTNENQLSLTLIISDNNLIKIPIKKNELLIELEAFDSFSSLNKDFWKRAPGMVKEILSVKEKFLSIEHEKGQKYFNIIKNSIGLNKADDSYLEKIKRTVLIESIKSLNIEQDIETKLYLIKELIKSELYSKNEIQDYLSNENLSDIFFILGKEVSNIDYNELENETSFEYIVDDSIFDKDVTYIDLS